MAKKQREFFYTDYNPKKENFGISQNGEYIYTFDIHKNPAEVAHYKFEFEIQIWLLKHHGFGNNPYTETFSFCHKCNLHDYITKEKVSKFLWEDNPENEEDNYLWHFDFEKLVAEVCPDRDAYYKERLLRKYKLVEKESVICQETNEEFLEFTPETACSWAGSYEQDGKQGCSMSVKEKEEKLNFPDLNFKQKFSYWHCNYALHKKLDKIGKEKGFVNGDYYIYGISPEEKETLFDSFSLAEQFDVYRKFLKGYTEKEMLNSLLPYKIHLAGNDDCSYSKWFATEEELITEIKYLRAMQPLDFKLDIYNRDYIFTN